MHGALSFPEAFYSTRRESLFLKVHTPSKITSAERSIFDLGKTVFHLAGINRRGEVVVRKKFSRKQLLHFIANLHNGQPEGSAAGYQ
jgi:hypothetical protein